LSTLWPPPNHITSSTRPLRRTNKMERSIRSRAGFLSTPKGSRPKTSPTEPVPGAPKAGVVPTRFWSDASSGLSDNLNALEESQRQSAVSPQVDLGLARRELSRFPGRDQHVAQPRSVVTRRHTRPMPRPERGRGMTDAARQVCAGPPCAQSSPRTGSRCRYWPWAELMRLTLGLPVDTCPQCGGCMKLRALVRDPESIERFLRHQNLWTEPHGLAEARPPPYFRSVTRLKPTSQVELFE
jgi:hypothetical protein